MWPWDWVIAAGNAISGLSQKAVDWVNSLIASVMSWVTDAINAIWSNIQSVWNDITNVWNGLLSFINTIASDVWNGIEVLTRNVTQWIADGINGVRDFAQGLYNWISNEVANLGRFVDGMFNQIYRYIKEVVLDPLTQLYHAVLNWATSLFNKIWQYIQHPELLVNLIAGYLFSIWLQLARRFAVPLVRWIINLMRTMAGEVFDLLEEIISSII